MADLYDMLNKQQGAQQQAGTPQAQAIQQPMQQPMQQQQQPDLYDVLNKQTPKVGIENKEAGMALADTNMPWKQVLLHGIQNTPASAGAFIRDMANTFLHPIETAKNLTGLAVGTMQKAIPGQQGQEKYFDQMVDYFKDRYGSVEDFKNSLAQDPVGVFADGASFVAPGGSMLKGAGTATKLKYLQRIGNVVKRTGQMIDPASAVAKAPKMAAKLAIPKILPSAIYDNAVSFASTLPKEVRQRFVNTALEKSIAPSQRGMDKLYSSIQNINKEIDDIIQKNMAKAIKAGDPDLIEIEAIFDDLNKVQYESLFTSQAGLKAVQRIKDNITKDFKAVDRKYLTPEELNKMKIGLQKEVKTVWDETMNETLPSQIKRNIYDHSTFILNEIYPELKKLQADSAELIELRKALAKPVDHLKRRDVLPIIMRYSIPGTISGGIGGMAGGASGAILGTGAGLLLGVVGSPHFQAKLAIALDRVRRTGGMINPDSMAAKTLQKMSPVLQQVTTPMTIMNRAQQQQQQQPQISPQVNLSQPQTLGLGGY